MLIPTFAGSEITDSARGGGLYFRDILLNISFLGGQMDIRMFQAINLTNSTTEDLAFMGGKKVLPRWMSPQHREHPNGQVSLQVE